MENLHFEKVFFENFENIFEFFKIPPTTLKPSRNAQNPKEMYGIGSEIPKISACGGLL